MGNLIQLRKNAKATTATPDANMDEQIRNIMQSLTRVKACLKEIHEAEAEKRAKNEARRAHNEKVKRDYKLVK